MRKKIKKEIAGSGILITTGTFLSRILGFIREVVIAALFGVGHVYDAFLVAYSIPSLFRRVFGEETFERAFLPKWKRLKEEGRGKVANLFLKKSFVYTILLILAVSIILYLGAPLIVKAFAPGFSYKTYILSLKLTYILIPFMLLIGTATFFGAIILFKEKPLIYSLAPSIFNTGIIIFILLFHKSLRGKALAYGFIFGAFLYILFEIPFLKDKRDKETNETLNEDKSKKEAHNSIKESFKEGGIIFTGSLIGKSVQLVDRIVASFVSTGAISSLWLSFRIINLPFAILSLSVNRALAPLLSKLRGKKDKRGFREAVELGIFLNFSLLLPLTIFFMLYSKELIYIIFKRGSFNEEALNLTSSPFFWYSLGLIPMGLVSLYNRVFSSFEKNAPTLYGAAVAGVINIIFDLLLYRTSLQHGGIAFATSIAFFSNFLFLALYLDKKSFKIRWGKVLKKFLAVLPFALISTLVFLFFKVNIVKFNISSNSFILFLKLSIAFFSGIFFYIPVIFALLKEKRGIEGKLKVIFTGGGTGGHVYPNIAIYQILKKEVLIKDAIYVGVKGRVEEKVVPNYKIPLIFINSAPIYGRNPAVLLGAGFTILKGTLKSIKIIFKFKPDLIIASGSYTAAPMVFAASILKPFLSHRIVIHEQNVIPGLLNKLSSILADVEMVSFKETAYFLWSKRCVLTGYPVREEFLKKYLKKSVKFELKIPEGKKLVLIFGGSLGSRSINRAMVNALKYFKEKNDIFIVHSCGISEGKSYNAYKDTISRLKKEFPDFNEKDGTLKNSYGETFYIVKRYIENLFEYEKAADLLVIRGGAGSVSEALSLGKAMIIVPKKGLPNDHQELNAIALAEKGVAEVVFEKRVRNSIVVDDKELKDKIEELLLNKKLRRQLSLNAKKYFIKDYSFRIKKVIKSTVKGEELDFINEIIIPEFVRIQKTFDNLISFLEDKDQSNLYYRYYENRIDEYLSSKNWAEVNKGIKLIGALKKKEKLNFIKKNFENFNGFQKRNALIALKKFDEINEGFKEIILSSLSYGYFEVRREAFSLIKKFHTLFKEKKDRIEIEVAIKNTINELKESFEVKTEAIKASVYFLYEEEFFRIIDKFLFSRNVKLREALLDAVKLLLKNKPEMKKNSALKRKIKNILITTSSFKPEFIIRKKYREVIELLEESNG